MVINLIHETIEKLIQDVVAAFTVGFVVASAAVLILAWYLKWRDYK